jgi:hypothetical protein
MSIKFKKRLLLFVSPIMVLVFVFVFLVQYSGPRIRSIQLDDSLLNQQLVITFNADIASIENIEIKPDISFNFSHNNYQMFVTFTTPLQYNSNYEINMKATDTRGTSSFQTAKFTTLDPEIYYLNRSDTLFDSIYRTTLSSDVYDVVYEAESILLYDFTPSSFLVVEDIDAQQIPLVKQGDKFIAVELPDSHTIDSVDGSHTQDVYIFTLVDTKTYRKSVWEFSAKNSQFVQLKDDQLRPIIGSHAQFAPDGKSIFYLDSNRSLVLLSSESTQVPINIGVFDTVNRILPNEKGIFGYKNNKFATILSTDGSEQIAPKIVQSSSLTQQFNSLNDFVFIEQELDTNQLYLQQNLISYINNNKKILSFNKVKESLILFTSLSPNDEFILTEEALQPVIYDGVYPNGRPKNGFTNFIDTKNGTITKTLTGYDVKWKL